MKDGEVVPLGWAVLPLFDPLTRTVAGGAYHLPLFEGLPTPALLAELAAEGPAGLLETVPRLLRLDRLRYAPSRGGVLVRLLDAQWAGLLPRPAPHRGEARALQEMYAAPAYLSERERAELRASLGSKSYREGAMVPGGRYRGEPITPALFSAGMARAFARGLLLPGWEVLEADWPELAQPKQIVLNALR